MDPEQSTSGPPKPKKQRASTSTKNRARSPSPFRSTAETNPDDFMQDFWNHTLKTAENHEDDFKHQALPLARIKKVAKMDPDVQMISSEVTVLFEKACQIFIQELTARAHLVSIESKRRTISRTDVAQAVGKSDTFDFLIDIVPREERTAGTLPIPSTSTAHTTSVPHNPRASTSSSASTSSHHPHQTRTSTSSSTTLDVSAPSNKRPTRNRKVSEKARMGDEGLYEVAGEVQVQNGATYEYGQSGGTSDEYVGGGQVDGNRNGQEMILPTANQFPDYGIDQSLQQQYQQQPSIPPGNEHEDLHQDKRSRIEGQEAYDIVTGGETGHDEREPLNGDEEEDEEDEDEEELVGDGAFEGWDGLELGFK